MPKMKYFQIIADMRNYHEDRLSTLTRNASNPIVLDAYELSIDDQPVLERKIKTLQYLIDCERGYSSNGTRDTQPSYADFENVFAEQCELMSQKITALGDATHPQMKAVRQMYKERKQCAEYYLEKLNDPVYLAKLPVVIEP